MNDRELDINYLTPLLGFRDLVPFLASYESWPQRIHAAESILFKGLAYQHDVQDFLARPRGRLQVARLRRETGASAIYDAVWERRSLAGMSVDWAARKVQLPAWADTRNRELAEGWLLREPHWHFEELATYRRRWLGAILDRYRGTRTKVIFLRLPRGPVVRPDLPAPDPASSIRQLAARRRALLMDEPTFDLLERPELFGDAMHLNEAGGTEFSQIAAREVGRMLGEAGR